MRRRSLIIFVIINVFVSLGVVLIVLSALNPPNQGGSQPILVTVPLIITATENPNATPEVIIVTATPRPGEVILPTDLQTEIALGETGVPIPTIDAALLESSEALRGTTTAMPTNCIPYVLQEGDTPFAIAVEYGVDPEEFMAVNGLDDETASFLQIGQVLIVPLAGCELTSVSLSASQTATYLPTNTLTPSGTLPSPSPTASVTRPASATPTRTTVPDTPTPSRTPTATIPPTAENAQVEIVQVRDRGNVTAEGVEIRNNGPVIDLSGWTLTDGSGSTYTFPNERRLFQGGLLTVYSRVGEDTAIALFWDRTESVWSSGETVTLLDDEEQAQSVYQIP
jgi:LysM repeat protein